jgi:hypothetical protein
MALSLGLVRKTLAVAAALGAVGLAAAPRCAAAHELALAQGTIAISEPATGERAPACGEMVVEARDALDNRLIARTQPVLDTEGGCRYAVSVPAQSAVWLRVRPALVASERVVAGESVGTGAAPARGMHVPSGRSVALRFTVIAPTTYFFAPGERKTVPLSY